MQQIDEYEWTKYFEKIFVTNQQNEKIELLKDVAIDKTDWLIGDTGYDIQTGKRLGMKTAAVLSGYLNQGKLKEYQPDIILSGVQDFTV